MEPVAFTTAMADGTAADYARLGAAWQTHRDAHLADSVLAMRGPTLGYKIDRYQHSLQSAGRAAGNSSAWC